MTALTDAERSKLKRDRRKAGLVQIIAWVPVEREDAVRAAIVEAILIVSQFEIRRG